MIEENEVLLGYDKCSFQSVHNLWIGGFPMRKAVITSVIVVIIVAALFIAKPVTAQPALIDLGTLGGNEAIAFDINNNSQVVGRSQIADGQIHAFLWENSTMIDLGTADGYFRDYIVANAINDSSQVVGVGFTGTTQRGFLWQNGTMTILPSLWIGSTSAEDINNQGSVVGSSQVFPGDNHAFLYKNGEMIDLGTLGGRNSFAFAINDDEVIVGSSETASGETHSTIWRNGQIIDLGTLGGNYSVARGINSLRHVVGTSIRRSGPIHAFLWTGTEMIDLQRDQNMIDNRNKIFGIATDINAADQVVGQGQFRKGQDTRAFLWEKGVLSDLGTLGGSIASAEGINQLGQVVGFSSTPAGFYHAFLWTR
jgi:probable HAF family extracellular repeat protein